MIIAKLLNPKLDYVFKRIFGSNGSEEITKDFLRAVTKENITDNSVSFPQNQVNKSSSNISNFNVNNNSESSSNTRKNDKT